jgi:L-2-hydroxyglutarate oxidase LhgO
MDVIIVGAGIRGLTLGLTLQSRGIPCRISIARIYGISHRKSRDGSLPHIVH